MDGTVHTFGSNGRWTSTIDSNANTKTATFDAMGRLAEVSFPDGRREAFVYDGSGKLATIREIGADLGGGSPPDLEWTYSWNGDDLARIDRPDGTAVEFSYTDPAHPAT